jgi:uncharacterized membrane protein
MKPRTLTIALIASLTINVFLLSAVGAGAVMRYRAMEERGRHMKMGNPLFRVGERLPHDVRDRYIARMRQEGAAAWPRLKEARAARAEAAKAMAADPYDPAAVSAALARARVEEAATRATLESAVVDFARDIGPKDRAIIADALRKPTGGRRGGHASGPPAGAEGGERPSRRD